MIFHYAGSTARLTLCGKAVKTLSESEDVTGYIYNMTCAWCLFNKIQNNKIKINKLDIENKNLHDKILKISRPK